MTPEQIPTYNDPTDFVNGDVKYPCNTQYMVYDPYTHRYFLTEEGLNYYGIDVQRKYISNNRNKTKEFINKVSKKIYDYINYKAGYQNFQVQMYRIAVAPKTIYSDQYAFRKQFEEILIAEAQWLIDNGDSAKYSYDNMEKMQKVGTKPEEDWRNTSDIAPEAVRSLEFLGLTRWFSLIPFIRLDQDKY